VTNCLSGVARFLGALVHTIIGGPHLKQKIGISQNEHRPCYTKNTSQLFIGVNLPEIVGVKCRKHSNGTPGIGSAEGVSPSSVEVGSGAPENFFDFVLQNVELLCILDSGAGR